MAYICICNNITEKDLERDPGLICLIGTTCGKCVSDGGDLVSTDGEIGTEDRSMRKTVKD